MLKRCEALGLLGPEGKIGVRLQRPDVAKRMVEKGTRSFRVERATNEVKILDVEAPARNAPGDEHPGDENPSREETDDEDDAALPRSRANAGDAIAVERLTEAVEDFHPVLRPYH